TEIKAEGRPRGLPRITVLVLPSFRVFRVFRGFYPTNTPPVNPAKASKSSIAGGVPAGPIALPRYAVTREPAPVPEPMTRSARVSPSRSLTATRTPPRLAGPPPKKWARASYGLEGGDRPGNARARG